VGDFEVVISERDPADLAEDPRMRRLFWPAFRVAFLAGKAAKAHFHGIVAVPLATFRKDRGFLCRQFARFPRRLRGRRS